MLDMLGWGLHVLAAVQAKHHEDAKSIPLPQYFTTRLSVKICITNTNATVVFMCDLIYGSSKRTTQAPKPNR